MDMDMDMDMDMVLAVYNAIFAIISIPMYNRLIYFLS